jgi:hypothetical protein
MCAESACLAIAANAQWFEIAIQEQIAIATATQRMLAFMFSVGFKLRGHVRALKR